jgi:hypothetical protein
MLSLGRKTSLNPQTQVGKTGNFPPNACLASGICLLLGQYEIESVHICLIMTVCRLLPYLTSSRHHPLKTLPALQGASP